MPMCEGKHVPASTEAQGHRKGRGWLDALRLWLALEVCYIPQQALLSQTGKTGKNVGSCGSKALVQGWLRGPSLKTRKEQRAQL